MLVCCVQGKCTTYFTITLAPPFFVYFYILATSSDALWYLLPLVPGITPGSTEGELYGIQKIESTSFACKASCLLAILSLRSPFGFGPYYCSGTSYYVLWHHFWWGRRAPRCQQHTRYISSTSSTLSPACVAPRNLSTCHAGTFIYHHFLSLLDPVRAQPLG